MDIVTVFERYPNKQACIDELERIKWKGIPQCPYCKSDRASKRKDSRYQCNNCKTAFSVTVGTIFHATKLPIQKWFLAICLVLNAKKGIAARQLGRDLHVTKDTAWRILMQIRRAMVEYGDILKGIVEADETYAGGKNKNRHNDKKTDWGQGRGGNDKIAVAGVVSRGGDVNAKAVKDVSGNTLKRFILERVQKEATLITDEWASYNSLNNHYDHQVVKHGTGVNMLMESSTQTL